LLGVGAAKAGTTWLHDQLSAQPESDFGFNKEYHIFDVVHIPSCANMGVATPPGAWRALRDPFAKSERLRWKFQNDQSAYFRYFAGLLSARDVRLTGDITPSYCALPQHVLADIRDQFAAMKIRLRVIFLMRDPIEACWSSVRMLRARVPMPDGFDAHADEFETLARTYRGHGHRIRFDYPETIRKLEAVFDAEHLWFGFYEELFRPDTRNQISQFLGIPFASSDPGKVVNSSPKQAGILPEALEREMRVHFSPLYAFVREKFGAARMDNIWRR